ncbi:hypothetical protein [Amycolatopsis sp. CA-230715]|nr:hypothetical protein [Amycolatopsis sp. CA-230715]QWF84091.1 hypothetical protein HUW46_07535 [Amycolatopsis sp. CA-230715]
MDEERDEMMDMVFSRTVADVPKRSDVDIRRTGAGLARRRAWY